MLFISHISRVHLFQQCTDVITMEYYVNWKISI
uniref:Uncharacterized protein n=1 Tax=Anguilla anguilla TaxID=7936 RepID=A0A0E9XPW0_ANGAN